MLAQASRYTRLRTIASGGMGTVFLGRMEGAGGFERLVAIKVMHKHLAESPEQVSMFLDEARLAASVRHPNVVSMLDIDAGDDGLSLVMEYVDGPSLQKMMAANEERGEKLPLEIALRITIDALSGLHAAHELIGPDGRPAGLVHRDVSPQNILLGTDGVARIADFGIALAAHRLAVTRDGEVKGNLSYMSIDQLREGPIDRRSDVYSAGIVLWELLAGRRLFQGDSAAAVVLSAIAGPLQSPSDIDEHVPPPIDDACMRALCKAPEDRWPTAAAFAEALEDAALAIGLRIARTRDVAMFLAQMDEDGPTRLKPQAAMEWVARITRARAAPSDSGVKEIAPPEPGVNESGVTLIRSDPALPAPRIPIPTMPLSAMIEAALDEPVAEDQATMKLSSPLRHKEPQPTLAITTPLAAELPALPQAPAPQAPAPQAPAPQAPASQPLAAAPPPAWPSAAVQSSPPGGPGLPVATPRQPLRGALGATLLGACIGLLVIAVMAWLVLQSR